MNRNLSIGIQVVVALLLLPFAAIYIPISGRNVRAETITILSLLIVILADKVLTHRRFVHTKLNKILLTFIAILTISVIRVYFFPIFSLDAETRLVCAVNGIRLILAYSSFFIVLNYVDAIRSKHLLEIAVKAIIVASFITSIVAILLILNIYAYLHSSLSSSELIYKVQYSGAVHGFFGFLYACFVSPDRGWHVWSKTIAFQAFLLFGLFLVTKSRRLKILYLLYFIFLSTIIFFLSIRSTIVGLIISCAIITSLQRKDRFQRYLSFAVIALVLLVSVSALNTLNTTNYYIQRVQNVVPDVLGQELDITKLSNIGTRVYAFENTKYLLQNNFRTMIFGGGYHGFSFLTENIIGMEWATHAHNSFLQIIGDQGIIGFAIFVFLLVRLYSVLMHNLQERVGTSVAVKAVDFALIGYFIFLLLNSIVGINLYEPTSVLLLFVLLGCRMAEISYTASGGRINDKL